MKGLLPYTLQINGRLLDLSEPHVMGILNVTPDSFYAGSRKQTGREIARRVEQILEEGGTMIDIGAYSSRPGAGHVSKEEEMSRLRHGLDILRQVDAGAVVSVDTFRADVAAMCVEEYGAGIVNDISGGEMDSRMFGTVARLGVPYVLMHMQGTPQDMQREPHYGDVVAEVMQYFARRVQLLRELGAKDIILDPGFGFGKTLAHNYELMNRLELFDILELPVLVGVSRKSMVYKLLDCTPDEALNGTTVLHTLALLKGASILRVHDVKACCEAVRIVRQMLNPK
ncbi:MAG: dihydropteroate synthase [Paraprevotella sp.]|nr:dihydropteroate synthase [Paraprevotella sp.]